MAIFTEQLGYSILDLGFDKTLTKFLSAQQGPTDVTPELINSFSQGTSAKSLLAGELISSLEQQTGAVFSGKTAFDNTQIGYRLGIDTDGTIKFYIGDSSNYLNWTGSALNIAGALTATSGVIGGWTVAATTISGSNIVLNSSGLIQTASSGQRIEIGNLGSGIQFYNTDGTSIATIQPTDSGTLFTSTSPNTASRMFQFISLVQNGSDSNPMVELQAADVSTGTVCIGITQKGDANAIDINLASSSIGRGIDITHLGDGIVGYFELNNINANSHTVEIYNKGTNAAATALYVEQTIASVASAQFKNTIATSTNFYRIMQFNGGGTTRTLWISDGTTPNGNLSGTVGDVCFYGPSGQPFYCTGGTNWTGM